MIRQANEMSDIRARKGELSMIVCRECRQPIEMGATCLKVLTGIATDDPDLPFLAEDSVGYFHELCVTFMDYEFDPAEGDEDPREF